MASPLCPIFEFFKAVKSLIAMYPVIISFNAFQLTQMQPIIYCCMPNIMSEKQKPYKHTPFLTHSDVYNPDCVTQRDGHY